jgi:Mce-associated membrane protein
MAPKAEGWYADPTAPSPRSQRYWNGYQWTAHTRTAPTDSLGNIVRGPEDDHPEDGAPDAPAPSTAVGPLTHEQTPSGVRTTLLLVAAIVLLVGVAAAEGWYLWLREDPVVSSARPVVTGEVAHRSAVEAASDAADEIVSTSYKNYDEQVEQAVGKMTDGFATKYRQTAEDVRAEFVHAKKEVQVEVAAAGVVRASDTQVQALLFLNQYVSTDGQDTSYTPYRALVTVVDTDQGWLVSDIDTQ